MLCLSSIRIVECTKKLLPLYDDRDKSFRNELEKIRQRGYIHEFYSRFSEIRRNHEQNPDIPVERDDISFEPNVQFSGEEWYGRFVDFHQFYEKYLNLPVFKKSSKRILRFDVEDPNTKERSIRTETGNVDYKAFVTRVFEFWRVQNHKKNKDYVKLSGTHFPLCFEFCGGEDSADLFVLCLLSTDYGCHLNGNGDGMLPSNGDEFNPNLWNAIQ